MTDENGGVGRRGFLRAVAGAGTVGAMAGPVSAQDDATATPTTTGGGNQSTGGNQSSGNETSGGNQSSGNESGSGGGGGLPGAGQTKEVVVGPGGELVFEPDDLEILAGTTVHFVWDSDTHNIVVDSQPSDANWQGTAGGPSEVYDTGHEYNFQFTVPGEYEYHCEPHLSAGMEASISVVEEKETPGGGAPQVPDSAKTLGIATTIGMASTLGLAYFFLKYGGDYERE